MEIRKKTEKNSFGNPLKTPQKISKKKILENHENFPGKSRKT
jgi:hypothetical protein